MGVTTQSGEQIQESSFPCRDIDRRLDANGGQAPVMRRSLSECRSPHRLAVADGRTWARCRLQQAVRNGSRQSQPETLANVRILDAPYPVPRFRGSWTYDHTDRHVTETRE